MASQLAAVIKPRRRIARRQNSGVPKDSNVHLLAANVLNFEIARSHIRDELRFVIAFERIRKKEIIRHNAIQSVGIATHHGLDPIVVQLANMLLDFNRCLKVYGRRFHV